MINSRRGLLVLKFWNFDLLNYYCIINSPPAITANTEKTSLMWRLLLKNSRVWQRHRLRRNKSSAMQANYIARNVPNWRRLQICAVHMLMRRNPHLGMNWTWIKVPLVWAKAIIIRILVQIFVFFKWANFNSNLNCDSWVNSNFNTNLF